MQSELMAAVASAKVVNKDRKDTKKRSTTVAAEDKSFMGHGTTTDEGKNARQQDAKKRKMGTEDTRQ